MEKHKNLNYLLLFITLFFYASCYADTISDPCAGAVPLLNIIDRPTKSDSACVVPFKSIVLESGYEYVNLIGSASGQNYPQMELRVGLPLNNEFSLLLPNYNTQTVVPRSGFDAPVIGLKHEIGYNAKWLGAAEVLLTLPAGGSGFGTAKLTPTVNGLVEYTFNAALSLELMLGVEVQSLPQSQGSRNFTTINPDLTLTWVAKDNLQFYAEVYGQTRTGPKQGAAYIFDGGVLYSVFHNFEVDAEFGHRLSGKLGGLNNYYGVGCAIYV